MRRVLLLSITILLAAGCHKSEPPAEQQTSSEEPQRVAETGGLQLPGSFLGEFPCADCPGIRHHLDIWPDGTYHLRREWRDRNRVRFELGRWHVDPERNVLILQSGGERPLQFEILAPNKVRQLDIEGQHIESSLRYDLVSSGVFFPVDVVLPMGGELSMQDNVLRFTECLTGRNMPVSTGLGDYGKALEVFQKADTTSLYVTIDGSIRRGGVRVERFINAWPGEGCERSRADAKLVGTYWRIDRLLGMKIEPAGGKREARVLLRDGENGMSYSATVGCNQLAGAAKIDGEDITFSAGPTTLMACPAPLDMFEKRLVDVLGAARHWSVVGNTLELKDESGNTLALCEAVYL